MTTATITEQRIAATVTETTIAATVTETTIAATIGNAPGAAGPGLPAGGAVGQVPRKASTTDYDTAWDTLDAADVGADAAGTAAGLVAAHEADSTNVHGIADTAQLVLKNAANTIGAFLQTILGSLRIGSAGATDARLRVDDNGSAASVLVEFHQDNGAPWLQGYYNDTFSPDTPAIEHYVDDDGTWYVSGTGDTDIWFSSGSVNMLTLRGATGDAEIGRDVLAGRDVTAARNVSGANLALGGKLTTPGALTFEGGASTIKLDGASDLQALAWDAAQSKYRPRTISGGGGQGATTTTADATGATDATAQLQADMATAAAAGHKRLYLPAGTYKISLTTGVLFTTATDDIEIFGDGIGKTILQVAAGTTLTGDLVFFRLTGKFQQVHDLTIDGGATTTVSTFNEYGIQVYQGAFDSYVHDIECYNINGSGTAGGAGITTYQPYNQAEVSTTLGTTILAGARTVTPASMVGIYAGRTLTIGGSTETIQVTSVTATTFTATFANNHSSSDAVTGTSMGHQRALITRCIVHDSYLATAFILNSAANVVSDCKVIRVGSSSTQHGFYIQQGQNVIDRWYCEGVGGYSIHGYIDTTTTDATGNRYLNGVSINPGTQHLIASSATAGSTNPDIPNGEQLSRYVVVMGNVFRRTKTGPLCDGILVTNGGDIIGNVFEDAIGKVGGAVIGSSSGQPVLVANNIIRLLNGATPNNSLGIASSGGVVSNNLIQNWTGATGPIRLEDGGRAIGNYIKAGAGAGGTAIICNGANVVISNNYIDYTSATSGTGIGFNQSTANMANVRVSDNTIICGSNARGIDFFAAGNTPTGTISNNSWTGANTRYYDVPSGLFFYNNKGAYGFRANATQMTMDAAVGRLLSFPKGTNTLTALLLVKIASGVLATLGTSDTVFYGVATSTTDATSANVLIVGALHAECPIACDGAWTAGNIGIASTTAAGKIHDSASATPPASGSYVLFLDTGGSAGNARCLLLKTL